MPKANSNSRQSIQAFMTTETQTICFSTVYANQNTSTLHYTPLHIHNALLYNINKYHTQHRDRVKPTGKELLSRRRGLEIV